MLSYSLGCDEEDWKKLNYFRVFPEDRRIIPRRAGFTTDFDRFKKKKIKLYIKKTKKTTIHPKTIRKSR